VVFVVVPASPVCRSHILLAEGKGRGPLRLRLSSANCRCCCSFAVGESYEGKLKLRIDACCEEAEAEGLEMLRWRGVDGSGGGGVEALLGRVCVVGVDGRALVKTLPSDSNSVSNPVMCKELRNDWRRLLTCSWSVRLNSCPGPAATGWERGLSVALMLVAFSSRGAGALSEVVLLAVLLVLLPSFTELDRPIPGVCEWIVAAVFVLKAISIPGKILFVLLSLAIALRPFLSARPLGPPKVPLPIPILSSTIPPNPPSGNRFT